MIPKWLVLWEGPCLYASGLSHSMPLSGQLPKALPKAQGAQGEQIHHPPLPTLHQCVPHLTEL